MRSSVDSLKEVRSFEIEEIEELSFEISYIIVEVDEVELEVEIGFWRYHSSTRSLMVRPGIFRGT